MKAATKCLGARCDGIAKKDLLTAADPEAKKKVLDAQKACHAGSGTKSFDFENDPEEAVTSGPIGGSPGAFGPGQKSGGVGTHDFNK